ncbi:MAG: hypothetical protein ABUT20_48555 [Bacteroidota bacterium]
MQRLLNIKPLFLAAFMLAGTVCFAQQEFDTPKNIPPFNMILSDGTTYYNSSNLEKGKALMIIYFDPECQHCQHFTKQVIKNISKFSTVQIVMICAAPGLPPLKKFVADFDLLKYKNMKVGTEGMYHATMNFYHVDVTPFTALYNKGGTLITSYRDVPEIQTLVSQFSK